MITDVGILDYQAIKEARLRLGQFTVITGPTGSGKSAVIRAIKLVVFNARGTSYIRHGAKSCRAVIGFERDGFVVSLDRGGRGADKYRILTAGQPRLPTEATEGTAAPEAVEFTKLAGGVPEQVSQVLRLGDLNFAGQFDRPFLLDATGGQVARTLGELTNVTLVLDAAREATRRKQETGRELKRAEAELESLKAQALRFRGLRQRRHALIDVDERLHSASLMSEAIVRLRKLGEEQLSAVAQHARAQRRLEAMAVPSLGRVEELGQSLGRLRSLESEISLAQSEAGTWRRSGKSAELAEQEAHRELHELLVTAGICPTCGQAVSGLWKRRRPTSTGRTS